MVSTPELKNVCQDGSWHWHITNTQYMDKRISVQLNGSRKVIGTLRGFDVSRGEWTCGLLLTNRFS